MDIRNVFVVMGDPTEIGDYPEAMDDFDLVPSGLIRLIKCGFNVGVDHAGVEIGQPTTFYVGCALNFNAQDVNQEIKNLHRKIESGADFILTQPVFQLKVAESFLNEYHKQHKMVPIPILVGVLPLFSHRHASFLHNEVPGIVIPEVILGRMKDAGGKAPQEGLRIADELIQGIRSWASGIYLMPAFNRYDLAVEIVEKAKG
jgi:homocysteine S-methyltransferase